MSSTATVNILVSDINDEAPVFSEASAFRVKEVFKQLFSYFALNINYTCKLYIFKSYDYYDIL